jgi:hypothetical protein
VASISYFPTTFFAEGFFAEGYFSVTDAPVPPIPPEPSRSGAAVGGGGGGYSLKHLQKVVTESVYDEKRDEIEIFSFILTFLQTIHKRR